MLATTEPVAHETIVPGTSISLVLVPCLYLLLSRRQAAACVDAAPEAV